MIKILKYLSDISYSIYIVHSALLIPLRFVLMRHQMNNYTKAICCMIAILFIIPLAHITSVHIEKNSGDRNPFNTIVWHFVSLLLSLV